MAVVTIPGQAQIVSKTEVISLLPLKAVLPLNISKNFNNSFSNSYSIPVNGLINYELYPQARLKVYTENLLPWLINTGWLT